MMKNEKNVLSRLIALIMGIQMFSSAVAFAETAADVTKVNRDADAIIITFDNSPKSDDAVILGTDMSEQDCMVKVAGNTLEISTQSLDNGKYYLRVDGLQTRLYDFTVNNMQEDWVTDSVAGIGNAPYAADEWMFMTPSKDNIKIYEYNDDEGAGQTVSYAAGATFLHDRNYADYIYNDADIEFDYKNPNNSDLGTNGGYGSFNVLLNTAVNTGSINQWATYIQSKQGAYILSLRCEPKGERLNAYIYKWDGRPDLSTQYGTGYQINGSMFSEENGSFELAYKNGIVENYAAGKEYRFKIKTRNVTEGVKVTLYVAEYNEGVLGEYKEALSCIDTESAILGGTAYFMSMSSDPNSKYLSTHYVKNIKIADTSIREIAADVPFVENVTATDNIIIDFSTPVNTASYDNIKVMTIGEEVMQFPCDITAEKDDASKVIVDLSMIPAVEGVEYHLSIDKGVQSAFGIGLDKQYDYTFTKKQLYDDFNAPVNTTDESGKVTEQVSADWKVGEFTSGNQNRYKAEYIYNNQLFLGGSNPLTTTHTNSDNVTIPINDDPSVVINNTYMDYNFENSALEFDYMSYVNSSYGNHSYDSTRVFFRGTNYVNCTGYIYNDSGLATGAYRAVKSDSGAYVLEISYNGKKVSLRKVGAEEVNYTARGDQPVGEELAALRDVEDYSLGDTVRYRIVTENTADGVLINVYAAKKTDGVLDDYKNILSYLDTAADAKTSGSFCFTVTGSNGGKYFYANSTVIDELMYTSVEIENLEDEENLIKERIDKIYNSSNWNIYEQEIRQLKEDYDAYVAITNYFDTEYTEKLNKLLTGKTNEEISKEVIEELSSKDSIKIVYIGGSLTAGGAEYQEMFKNYISEKTGILAENITIINVGNGGQGSAWHQVRLYDEVMSENPDIVFVDYAGNDDGYYSESNEMAEGVHKANLAAEVTIRRLLNMENAPVICFNIIPAKDRLVKMSLLNKGITHYINSSGNVREIEIPAYRFTLDVFEYYNTPVFNITEELLKYVTIKAADEDGAYTKDVTYETYKRTDVNTYEKSTDAEYLFNVTENDLSDFEVFIDYDTIEAKYAKEYNFNEAQYGSTFRALAADNVHPAEGYDGYKLYGDIILDLVENNTDSALRRSELMENPITKNADVYDRFNMTKKAVSSSIIAQSDDITIDTSAGGNYEDAEFTSANLRKVSGVRLTGPLTLTYKFKGHVFYPVYDNKDILVKYATVDNRAFLSNARYYNDTMLTNSDSHEFKVELPADVTLCIGGFFTDEDTLLNNFEKNKEYTMVDLSTAANVYGAYTEGDGKVFSAYNDEYKRGMTPDILVNYKENNWINSSPDAIEIYNYFTAQSYSGTPFNVESLLNKRFKAVSPVYDIVTARYAQWHNNNVLDEGNAELSVPTIDVPDDIYTNIHLLIADYNTDIAGAVMRINYADGTKDDVTFNTYYKTDVTGIDGAEKILTGTSYDNITGKKEGIEYNLYEYTLAVPQQKRIESISFTDGQYYRIYGLTLEKAYASGLFDISFKTADNKTVYNLEKYAGEALNVEFMAEKETQGEIILAVYDGRRMVSIKEIDVNTVNSSDYINIVRDTINIPADYKEGYSISAYLWDSTEEMMPLTVKIIK